MPIGILGQQKKASLLYTLDDNFDPVCFFCLPELHFRSEVFLTKNTNLEAMNKPAAMGQIHNLPGRFELFILSKLTRNSRQK